MDVVRFKYLAKTQHNMTITQDDRKKIILDKEIYPLDVIYTTSYVFLEKAYIFLKKGEKNQIIVEIEPKNGLDPGYLKREFNNQLINYAQHMKASEKNMDVKKKLLQEIFAYNFIEDNDETNLDFEEDIEDPDGILIPWEEKYKNDNN